MLFSIETVMFNRSSMPNLTSRDLTDSWREKKTSLEAEPPALCSSGHYFELTYMLTC